VTTRGVVSALAAPLVLVAGWTVAAALQPRPFNSVVGTVSALAAVGATDRWVMTLAFVVAGTCEVVTGLALLPAAAPGRLILMAGAGNHGPFTLEDLLVFRLGLGAEGAHRQAEAP
jgi:hypothetical protein